MSEIDAVKCIVISLIIIPSIIFCVILFFYYIFKEIKINNKHKRDIELLNIKNHNFKCKFCGGNN